MGASAVAFTAAKLGTAQAWATEEQTEKMPSAVLCARACAHHDFALRKNEVPSHLQCDRILEHSEEEARHQSTILHNLVVTGSSEAANAETVDGGSRVPVCRMDGERHVQDLPRTSLTRLQTVNPGLSSPSEDSEG